MDTPPVPWGVDTAPFYEAARRVAMESQTITQRTTVGNQCTATSNQLQSTTGVETLEVKNPLDTSGRSEDHTCTNIEVPHTASTVETTQTNSSNPAEESDMESVNISSDESDDDWSVISDNNAFVVVDSAETTHHHSDAKSRKKSALPKRVSKLHTRSRTSKIRQQKMMPTQNEQGMPKMKPAVDRSCQGDDEGTQRLTSTKATGNVIDELIERLTEQARALKL